MQAYNKITEDLMAVPGIYGRKTEKEKFAGGVFSEKTHAYLPNGKILEGTCFHHDGQNFSKAYKLNSKTKKEKKNLLGKTLTQFQQECLEECLEYIQIMTA
jgi:prolyl-tRNA synthetase